MYWQYNTNHDALASNFILEDPKYIHFMEYKFLKARLWFNDSFQHLLYSSDHCLPRKILCLICMFCSQRNSVSQSNKLPYKGYYLPISRSGICPLFTYCKTLPGSNLLSLLPWAWSYYSTGWQDRKLFLYKTQNLMSICPDIFKLQKLLPCNSFLSFSTLCTCTSQTKDKFLSDSSF
jgi:hypothetical protein